MQEKEKDDENYRSEVCAPMVTVADDDDGGGGDGGGLDR